MPATVTGSKTNLGGRFGRPLRVGTRGSALARAQTDLAVGRLCARFPDLPAPVVVPITTTGDKVQDRPLADIGGKGLFAKEIELALLAGDLDLAVHSLKDLETVLPTGLEIGAVLPRQDPRDALVSSQASTLAELPPGARVGTSSVRRAALLRAARADCTIVPIRGNIDTRLNKLAAGEVDALILALAGLKRLGYEDNNTHPIAVDAVLPSACQGVVALQCRAEDVELRDLLTQVNDADTNLTSTAERALLAALDGSCRTPIGAHAILSKDTGVDEDGDEGQIWLRGLLALPDGSQIFRAEGRARAEDVVRLGAELGATLRAEAPADLFAAA